MQNIEDASCKEYRSLIADYVSDNLAESEKDKLMLHIKSCPECEREFGELKQILDAAANIPEVEVPDTLRRAVTAEIAAAADTMKKRKKIYRYAVGTILPVAACAALAIGVFSGGIYDRVVNSDNMVAMEATENAGEGISMPETDGEGAEIQTEAAAHTEKDAKAPANTHKNNQQVKGESGSASKDAATDETSSVQQRDVSPDVNSAAVEVPEAVAQTEETEEYRIEKRAIASGGGSSATPETEAADYGISTVSAPIAIDNAEEEQAYDGNEAQSETAVEESRDVPISCVVITENPAEFAAGFGISGDGDEITFELSADKWIAFVNYNRECGTKLEAEFSGEKTEVISVTIKAE